MPIVTVIDYGIGNLLSVARAFAHCGVHVNLSADPNQIINADFLVLPGVGAFANGMAGLKERGLVEPIKEFVTRERPFLGICLGMQMMLDRSEEFGEHTGLGLIPGTVVAISPIGADGAPHKIPYIGWNEIVPPPSISWENTIFRRTPHKTSFYFVHSYAAVPVSPLHRLADSNYDGLTIAAAIRKDNLYGCQFHPEKSGQHGITVLKSFLELTE